MGDWYHAEVTIDGKRTERACGQGVSRQAAIDAMNISLDECRAMLKHVQNHGTHSYHIRIWEVDTRNFVEIPLAGAIADYMDGEIKELMEDMTWGTVSV
jgi:hypothetical protein